MAGHLRKRSFSLAGHRTSVALEPAFWTALEEEARRRAIPLARLVQETDAARADSSPPLASALRLVVLHALQVAPEKGPPPPSPLRQGAGATPGPAFD